MLTDEQCISPGTYNRWFQILCNPDEGATKGDSWSDLELEEGGKM